MKHFLLPLLATILMLSSCATKQFDQNLSKGFDEAQTAFLKSAIVVDKTTRTWHRAIYDNYDHKGNYVSDFNTALYRLHNELDEDGTFKELETLKKNLNDYAKALVNGPKSRKYAYDDFIILVTDVNALLDLAIEPEGSLQSYGSETKELAASIKKEIDAFKLKYSDFLVEVVEDKSNTTDDDEDW